MMNRCCLILLINLVLFCNSKSPIEHVVVLMLENRSFDHMLGFLKQSLNNEIDGLNGNESNPYVPFHNYSNYVTVSTDAPFVTINPGHSIQDATQQIFGGPEGYDIYPPLMNGFVANAHHWFPEFGHTVMQCFNSTTIPTLSTLAEEFGLIDRWYSSVPGPTEVNRFYVHSATSHGMTYNDVVVEIEGAPQKTIYQSLEEAGLSWNIYFEEFSTTLFFADMRKTEYYDNYRQYEHFEDDVRSGVLANYTFIEPRYFDDILYSANDQHPSHDVAQGELMVQNVYEILRAGPLWNSTLLIVTYDEHGGFYDHVPPPMRGVPNPDGINGTDPVFGFDRLGIRVPALFISPWINKGTLFHEPSNEDGTNKHYEHSSIPATLKKLFNLDDFLTERDAWAATFEDIFSQRSEPRTDCPEHIPAPPTNDFMSVDGEINDLQQGFMEFAGGLLGDDSWKSIKSEYEAGQYTKSLLRKFLKKE